MHQMFLAYYTTDCRFNAGEAARKAGFAPDSARDAGYRLLTRADVQAHLVAYRKQLGALHFDIMHQIIGQLDEMRLADARKFWDADGNVTDPETWTQGMADLVCGFEIEERMVGEGDAQEMIRTKKIKLALKPAVIAQLRASLAQIGVTLPTENDKNDATGGGNPLVLVHVTVGGKEVPEASSGIVVEGVAKKLNGKGNGKADH